MLGMIEGKRRKGPQRVRWLDSSVDSMDVSPFHAQIPRSNGI